MQTWPLQRELRMVMVRMRVGSGFLILWAVWFWSFWVLGFAGMVLEEREEKKKGRGLISEPVRFSVDRSGFFNWACSVEFRTDF